MKTEKRVKLKFMKQPIKKIPKGTKILVITVVFPLLTACHTENLQEEVLYQKSCA